MVTPFNRRLQQHAALRSALLDLSANRVRTNRLRKAPWPRRPDYGVKSDILKRAKLAAEAKRFAEASGKVAEMAREMGVHDLF